MLIHNLFHRSTYFHSVVPRLKSDPVIFLKGVKGAHLDKILKFIYSGKVALSRHQLKPILEVAKSLQVAGLCDANPTDILQQQQPSALGASRALQGNSGSGLPHVLQRQQQAAKELLQGDKRGSGLSSPPTTSSPSSFKAPGVAAVAAAATSTATRVAKVTPPSNAAVKTSPFKGTGGPFNGADYDAISGTPIPSTLNRMIFF